MEENKPLTIDKDKELKEGYNLFLTSDGVEAIIDALQFMLDDLCLTTDSMCGEMLNWFRQIQENKPKSIVISPSKVNVEEFVNVRIDCKKKAQERIDNLKATITKLLDKERSELWNVLD